MPVYLLHVLLVHVELLAEGEPGVPERRALFNASFQALSELTLRELFPVDGLVPRLVTIGRSSGG